MPKTVICVLALMVVTSLFAQELDQGCWVGKMSQRADYVSNDVATLRVLAEQGNPFAQNELGDRYAFGEGVEQSWEEAVKWYRKSAEQGDETAQTNLGRRYAKGQGVEQSLEEAAKWYRKAADQGDAIAQFQLGLCYDAGNGVGQSNYKAIKWITKAAEQEYLYAQFNLIKRYTDGDGVERSLNRAIELQRKVNCQKDRGWLNKAGLLNLGVLLETQHGLDLDDVLKLSEKEEERFLRAAVFRYPSDLLRAGDVQWCGKPHDSWSCRDGFSAEIFQMAGERQALMDILTRGVSQAIRQDGKPAKAFWGRMTILNGSNECCEPLFTWAVWSLRSAKNVNRAPLSKQSLLMLLDSLKRVDPQLGQDLLAQVDASGTLPLYLAIQCQENDVVEAMIHLYDTSSLQELRGRDPMGKIVPSGESNNPANFAVSVMDCAVLADNADIVRLLVTQFSWPLDKKELWGGNAKDSPLSKAEYYHCDKAKRVLLELSTH